MPAGNAEKANVCVLRVVHIRFIAFAVAAPGLDRPDDDGVLAKERLTKAFAVPRTGPKLLFVTCTFEGSRHRLPNVLFPLPLVPMILIFNFAFSRLKKLNIALCYLLQGNAAEK